MSVIAIRYNTPQTNFVNSVRLHSTNTVPLVTETRFTTRLHGECHCYCRIVLVTTLYKMWNMRHYITNTYMFYWRPFLFHRHRENSYHSSFSQFLQSWQKWQYWHQRILEHQKELPPVELDLMQAIITVLWVQHQTNWVRQAFACNTETLGSLCSHELSRLTSSVG